MYAIPTPVTLNALSHTGIRSSRRRWAADLGASSVKPFDGQLLRRQMPSSGSAIVFISRIRSDLLFAVRKYRNEGLGGMRVWVRRPQAGRLEAVKAAADLVQPRRKEFVKLAKEHTLV